MQRFGLTIPLDGMSLLDQREHLSALPDLGYTDVWSAETDGADAFTPLTLTSVWEPRLRLGTAIVPVFTRGPATLAQSVAAMSQAAPGRFVLGIGSSSDVIVQRWNATAFEQPYARVRDTLRFLRLALSGEKVTEDFETFAIKGFRLKMLPPEPVPVLVAALREGMLRLAGREGDGAIINWLSADDVATVAPIVRQFGPGPDGTEKEIVARIFVAPSEDTETVRNLGRYAIAAYLNVPVYRAFHEWLGRSEALGPMWQAWTAGDRQAALAAIPDEVVDQLIVHGSPQQCREHIQRYVDNGVSTPVVAILPFPGIDPVSAAHQLAPNAG